MKIIQAVLDGVFYLELEKHKDERGYFLESFSTKTFAGFHPNKFLQDNHSHSWHNVLRGMHFSTEPQAKLVRVIHGWVQDVVVDVRKWSPTFGQWFSNVLSDTFPTAVYIAPGFAHGFRVLSASADVVYKSSTLYNPEAERTLLWNDPDVKINWGNPYALPKLSAKDNEGLKLSAL